MSAKKHKLVMVKWRDAVHKFGWQDGEVSVGPEPDEILSVGWLLRKDKHSVEIALSIGAGNHAQTLQVPLGMIVSVHDLGELGGKP